MLTVKAMRANKRNTGPDLGASGLSVRAAPIPKTGYNSNSATKATTAIQTIKSVLVLLIAVPLVRAETTARSPLWATGLYRGRHNFESRPSANRRWLRCG